MTARGPLRRPLVLFGILLIGPAAGLAWIAWQSVLKEDRARTTEALGVARDAVHRAATLGGAWLEDIRAQEEKRPYYHYQARFMPEDVKASGGPAFVESPLATPAAEGARGPLAWFQWTTTGAA